MPRDMLRFPARLARPARYPAWRRLQYPQQLPVVADDLRFEARARYAQLPRIDPIGPPATPAIEGLAQSGLTLQRVESNPISSPAHAAQQTGLFPACSRTGMAILFRSGLEPTQSLIPNKQAASGPRVSNTLLGKWRPGRNTFKVLVWLNPDLLGYDIRTDPESDRIAVPGPLDYAAAHEPLTSPQRHPRRLPFRRGSSAHALRA